MSTTNKQRKPIRRQPAINLHDVERLFQLSNKIADSAEDILEQAGAYDPKFLKGIEQAKADVAAGRTTKVGSLRDLL